MEASSSGGLFVVLVLYLALVVFEIVAWWRTYAKAGRPGWGVLIPFYNIYLLCKIAERLGWWLVLFLIPFVNIVVALIVWLDVAKGFHKGSGFGVGLWLLTFIFVPILAFGAATYDVPRRAS